MLITTSKEELYFILLNPSKNWRLQNYRNESCLNFIDYYNPYPKDFFNPGEFVKLNQ